jgi:sulfite exporter TauE/SafE
MGLYLAGWWSGLTRVEALGRGLWRHLQPLTSRLIPVHSLPQALTLGALWGWLPCGLVYSTLLWAASQGNATESALLMLAFGLGTWPVLLATGLAADRIIILISHRLQLFPQLDHVLFLEHGTSVLSTHSALMRGNSTYETLYQAQAMGGAGHEE